MADTHPAFDYWSQSITYLKGVGPKRALVLQQQLGITTFADLLHYFPRRYVDRTKMAALNKLPQTGEAITVTGTLGTFYTEPRAKGRVVLKCTLHGEKGGTAELSWFAGAKWIQQKYKEGDAVLVYGKPTFFNRAAQFSHPEIELLRAEGDVTDKLRILPVYAGTDALQRAGLDSKGLRKLLHPLLQNGVQYLEEFLPPALLEQYQLMRRAEALRNIHFPESDAALGRAQYRLAFEELLLFELILVRRKAVAQATHRAQPFVHVGDTFNRFFKEFLPFELTGAQKRVLKEIRADVRRTFPMNRLVQGDVGSGKTMVAVLCMLLAADNEFQSTFMAPTEVLANQHYAALVRYLHPLGLGVELLTGSNSTAHRRRALANLASGSSTIAVGTHALLEDAVAFKNLGLTIIDEQHKFGVLQRSKLWGKAQPGFYPHNLVMTATPIPRTLALTLYGDLDVSVIDELPPGRKPITTVLRSEAVRLAMWGFLRRQLEAGRQVYVVYPLVEESAKTDLMDAVNGFHQMERYFKGYRVGLVHGRRTPEEKAVEMERFKAGRTHILVSTTVIEVGVDVPNATVMVIEHAERFGLSQLHQLRGRVGRGAEQSYCILMTTGNTSGKLGPEAKKRLEALVRTADGFKLAQVDLELRGPGDFLGTRQSGLPAFSVADLTRDVTTLAAARQAAQALLEQDADLGQSQHAPLRTALRAFQAKHQLDKIVA